MQPCAGREIKKREKVENIIFREIKVPGNIPVIQYTLTNHVSHLKYLYTGNSQVSWSRRRQIFGLGVQFHWSLLHALPFKVWWQSSKLDFLIRALHKPVKITCLAFKVLNPVHKLFFVINITLKLE